MSEVYIWFRLGFTLHWVEVLYCGTSPFGHKVFTGSNQSPWFDVQGFYRVKSVSPFRFTLLLDLLQGQVSLPGSMYKVFTGSNHLSFSIYKVFTGSNQSPFFDLQSYYKVKSVSLLRFTRFLQGHISLPFLNFDIFTMLNDSIPFRFTGFLQNNCNVAVNYPV